MYEYKPIVHPDPYGVDVQALMEMLLQAHYCLRAYGIPVILHCLTDLLVWHYFKLSLNSTTSKLTIEWWYNIKINSETPLTVQQLEDHTRFPVSEVYQLLEN